MKLSYLALPFLACDLFALLNGDRSTGLLFMLAVVLIGLLLSWLWTYGRLTTQDADYLRAVRSIKKTIALWVGVVIVEVALTYIL